MLPARFGAQLELITQRGRGCARETKIARERRCQLVAAGMLLQSLFESLADFILKAWASRGKAYLKGCGSSETRAKPS